MSLVVRAKCANIFMKEFCILLNKQIVLFLMREKYYTIPMFQSFVLYIQSSKQT